MVRMDDATLVALDAAAHTGVAHPVDVIRLVDEVRELWAELERYRELPVVRYSSEDVTVLRRDLEENGVRFLGPVVVPDLPVRCLNADEFLQRGGAVPPTGPRPEPVTRDTVRSALGVFLPKDPSGDGPEPHIVEPK